MYEMCMYVCGKKRYGIKRFRRRLRIYWRADLVLGGSLNLGACHRELSSSLSRAFENALVLYPKLFRHVVDACLYTFLMAEMLGYIAREDLSCFDGLDSLRAYGASGTF